MNNSFDKYDVQKIVENNQIVQIIRIIMSICGGLVAGILGLTGYNGFYFYIGLNTFIFVCLWMKSRFQHQKYFNSIKEILLGDFSSNILCFIMFWTLGFALIHVYE